jgi:hypothetical protein
LFPCYYEIFLFYLNGIHNEANGRLQAVLSLCALMRSDEKLLCASTELVISCELPATITRLLLLLLRLLLG